MKNFETSGFESAADQENKQEQNAETNPRIKFIHGEAYLEALAKELKDNTDAEALKESARKFIYEFFDTEMKNTKIFESREFGVSFPYTTINVAELARSIYNDSKHSEALLATENKDADAVRKEYVFGSAVQYGDGHQFTFVEEALHKMMQLLPQALRDLENDVGPKNSEVITMGLPMHQLGEINQKFVGKLGENPFGTMGDLYAEFIKHDIENAVSGKPSDIEFFGTSMGAGMAALAGEKLVKEGIVTQESGEKEPTQPRLAIRVDAPVSLSPSRIKKFQIPAGFIGATAAELLRSPYIRKVGLGQYAMMREVMKELRNRGIEEHVSKEEVKMKKEALAKLRKGLAYDVVLDEKTKITALYGSKDPTTMAPGFGAPRSGSKELSLGSKIISRRNPNVRQFSAGMSHIRPALRSGELSRLKNTAEAIRKLQSFS